MQDGSFSLSLSKQVKVGTNPILFAFRLSVLYSRRRESFVYPLASGLGYRTETRSHERVMVRCTRVFADDGRTGAFWLHLALCSSEITLMEIEVQLSVRPAFLHLGLP